MAAKERLRHNGEFQSKQRNQRVWTQDLSWTRTEANKGERAQDCEPAWSYVLEYQHLRKLPSSQRVHHMGEMMNFLLKYAFYCILPTRYTLEKGIWKIHFPQCILYDINSHWKEINFDYKWDYTGFIHELVSKIATSLTIMFCKKKKYSKQKKKEKRKVS